MANGLPQQTKSSASNSREATGAIPTQDSTGEITRWVSLFNTVGSRATVRWSELFDEFSRVTQFLGTNEHPGWSACIFRDDERGLDNVRGVTAMVLDYDGSSTLDEECARWGEYFGLIHTTKSHHEERHSFRVVLPLARPVSRFEFAAIWARLNIIAQKRLDGQCKDSSRFWYTPGVCDGGAFRAIRLLGEPMDPDTVLLLPEPVVRVAPVVEMRPSSPATQSVVDRARAYIQRMPPAVSGSRGHTACFNVARKLADFGLSEEDIFRLLRDEYNPRCVPPDWTDKELRHKASEAMDREIKNPIENRERAAQPRRSEPAEVNEDGEVIGWTDPELPPDPQAIDEEAAPVVARTMSQMLSGVLAKAKTGLREVGVSTCHYRLERMLAGFRPRMITVMGARTSFGKSSYAIMVTDEAMRRGVPVLLVSAEDSEETYAQRYMARRARVNSYNLRANNCDPEELARMEKWTAAAEHVPFFVDAVGKPAEWIAGAIREHCAQRGIKLVVVDYLQRITASKKTQDKRNEITHVTATISNAIKAGGAAGLLLSQLKRLEGNVNREPQMSDLKESGDIENMAEHIVLGWLTEEDNGDAAPKRSRFLKVEKNKDGPVDTRAIPITFDDASACFVVADGDQFSEFDDNFEAGDTRYGD